MDTLVSKENVPVAGVEDQVVPVSKLGPLTPRQPLLDLKQVNRVQSVDNLGMKSSLTRIVTPVCTPTARKSLRKIHPNALVFVEDENRQEKCSNLDVHKSGHLEDISEADVEVFVSQVLDKTVKQLELEKSQIRNNKDLKASDETTYLDEDTKPIISDTDVNSSAAVNTDTTLGADGSRQKHVTDKFDVSNQIIKESDKLVNSVVESVVGSPVRLTNTSFIDDALLENDSLLEDSCQSIAESSKSEEELLASAENTPTINVSKESLTALSDNVQSVHELNHKETRSEFPSFLEWVTISERVRSATSSVAGWVVPPEGQDRQLQWLPPTGRAVVTHNMACSPLPWPVEEKLTCLPSVTGVGIERTAASKASQVSVNECVMESATSCDHVVKHCAEGDIQSVTVSNILPQSDNAGETVDQFRSVMCSPIAPAMNSMSCSPIVVPMESKMCSPFQIPTQDMSVQNCAELQSIMCSPILIPSLDISTQTHSPAYLSVPCSPIFVPGHDVSIQNEAEVQSVFCSPMVPCPSQDKSVMVLGPDHMDTAVGPDFVPTMDVGITAKPTTFSVATEIDCPLMNTIATSMTPVKIGNKVGRKLTAEDIRKQHPRVVANELDTLRTENTRLSGLVQSLQRDSKRLVDQQELQARMEQLQHQHDELQGKYDTDMADLSTQIHNLHKQQKLLQEGHLKQMDALREDYESRDYYEHFVSSQKLVTQLQTDLQNYTQLLHVMEHSCSLQGELESAVSTNLSKITRTQNKIATAADHLKNKFKELVLDQETIKMEQLLLEDEQAKVEKERAEMAFIVSRCKDNVLKLDDQVEQLSTQLCQAMKTNTDQQSKLSTVTADLEKVTNENAAMTTRIAELTGTEVTLKGQVEELSASSCSLSKQLQEAQLSLSNSLKQHASDKEKYNDDTKMKQLAITNLERTLEMRESDIDMLEKDLFECREIICKQLDALKVADNTEKVGNTRIQQLTKQSNALKEQNTSLRATEEQLRTSLANVTEELSGTQDQAARLLKQQGTEIADSFTAIGQLSDHMTTFLNSLSKRHGLELDQTQAEAVKRLGSTFSGTGSQISGEIKASQSHSSLVSQILQAADNHSERPVEESSNGEEPTCQELDLSEGQNTEGEENEEERQPADREVCRRALGPGVTSAVESPHTVSRKRLGVSQNSAFAAIRSVNVDKKEKVTDGGESTSEQDKEISESGHGSADGLQGGAGEGQGADGEGQVGSETGELLGGLQLLGGRVGDERLPDQVSRMAEVFEKIFHMAQVIEKALWSSLHDIRLENDELNRKMSRSDYLEKRWQAELEVKQTELDRSDAQCKQLQQNLRELDDLYEQSQDEKAETKRELLEVQRLRGKVTSLTGEKEVLSQQVASLLAQIEQQTIGTAPGNLLSSQREILALQNKVEKYRDQLQKKDDCIEDISSKAARRIHKLEKNWKLADDEVSRLDELVTIVRRALRARAKTSPQDEDLKKLMKLIDGRDSSSK